jgi:RES domain-containing protein
MDLYRISKREFSAPDGMGGMFYPGRWHVAGFRVIYAAQSRSLAALEYLVHLNHISLLANNFVISTLFIPNSIAAEIADENLLNPGWTDFQNYRVTQSIGTNFLKEGKSLIYKVPSAIIQKEYNYLINPGHELMQHCKISDVSDFFFDKRLIK